MYMYIDHSQIQSTPTNWEMSQEALEQTKLVGNGAQAQREEEREEGSERRTHSKKKEVPSSRY